MLIRVTLVFFYSHSSYLFSFLLWISCISLASSSLSTFTSSSSYSLTFFYPFLILLPLPLICCGFNHCQAALKSPSDWHFLPERRGFVTVENQLQRPNTFNFQCNSFLSSVVLLPGIRDGPLTATHNGKALQAWLLSPVSHMATCIWASMFTLIARILKLPFTRKKTYSSVSWKTKQYYFTVWWLDSHFSLDHSFSLLSFPFHFLQHETKTDK